MIKDSQGTRQDCVAFWNGTRFLGSLGTRAAIHSGTSHLVQGSRLGDRIGVSRSSFSSSSADESMFGCRIIRPRYVVGSGTRLTCQDMRIIRRHAVVSALTGSDMRRSQSANVMEYIRMTDACERA